MRHVFESTPGNSSDCKHCGMLFSNAEHIVTYRKLLEPETPDQFNRRMDFARAWAAGFQAGQVSMAPDPRNKTWNRLKNPFLVSDDVEKLNAENDQKK